MNQFQAESAWNAHIMPNKSNYDNSSHLLLLLIAITIAHIFLVLLLIASIIVSSVAYPLPSQHADKIILAMIKAGDFQDWTSDFISPVDHRFRISLSATIFIPTDFDAVPSSSNGGANSSRFSVAYHIIPHRLSFADLRLLQPLSRLPGKSIVVTNSSVSDFTLILNSVLVSDPDLFLTSSVAIHGVASTLDFSLYGDFDYGNTTLAESLRPWIPSNHRRGGFNGSQTIQTSTSVSIAHFSTSSFLVPLALALL